MKKIRLGRSEMMVTKIGFGGIPIQRLTEEDAVKVVQSALDQGINWIDTANSYGTSEERIGRAIRNYDRHSIKIFTKGSGADLNTIRKQIELSLQRMNLSYLDLYQFHFVPSEAVWEDMCKNGTVDEILHLREKGLIRHVGASAHTIEAMLAVMEHPEIEVIQFPFNLIMEENGLKVLEKCKAMDTGFITMKPFGGGMLENASACIRFLLQYPEVVLDPGFETIAELKEVIALCEEDAPLSADDRAAIERLKKELGSSFCRRCGYCTPCPHDVSIIPLMTMESLIKRFHPEQILSGWIAEAVESHKNCVECGECEEKCPYKLSIREGMRQGVEAFRALPREENIPRIITV